MATLHSLLGRYLRRSKPRTSTVQRQQSPLGQMMEQFELELRWVPAIIPVSPGTGTINAAIATASPGDTIQLSAGIYKDFVVIPADLDGLILTSTGGSTVVAPYNDVTESLNIFSNTTPQGTGSGHLVSVLADDVQISNITFNGNGLLSDANATSSITFGGAPIWASKGISNSLSPGNGVSISNLTISNNVFLNLGGDAISLNNTVAGGTINNNTISAYGAETTLSPWAAVFLGDNSMANVSNNTVTVTTNNYGIQVDNIASSNNACFTNNNITVNQNGIGITINLTYGSAGNITVANNTISVANGVVSTSPFRTRGINLFSIYSGKVNLNDNTIGGAGVFDRGVDVWNTLNNANISGGSIGSSFVGLKVDGVDPYYDAGWGTTMNVANTTITGQSWAVQILNANVPTQVPASPVLAGRDGNVGASVQVSFLNGSMGTGSGGSLNVVSNANATYEARAILNNSANSTLNIAGALVKSGNMAFITDNRSPKQYDFGPGALQTGFVGVLGNASYSVAQGYGVVGNISSFNYTSASASPLVTNLTRDGFQGAAPGNASYLSAFGNVANGTFRVDLAAGNYTVTYNVGTMVSGSQTVRSTIITALNGNTTLATTGAIATTGASGNAAAALKSGNFTFSLAADTSVDFRFNSLTSGWAVNGLSIVKNPEAPPT